MFLFASIDNMEKLMVGQSRYNVYKKNETSVCLEHVNTCVPRAVTKCTNKLVKKCTNVSNYRITRQRRI